MSLYTSSSTLEGRYSIRRALKTWTLHRFTSSWEYVVITLGCTFTHHNLSGLVVIQDANDSAILQHIICYLIIGLPINYLQILMGQYSQLGAIYFKHMAPVGHGVGYALLINSFVWCCWYGMLLADILMYILSCADTNLIWMFCHKDHIDHCWDGRSNCTSNCINENVVATGFSYYKEIFLHDPDFNPKHLSFGKPIFVRVVSLSISWALIFALVTMGIDRYKKIIRINFYITWLLFITILLVCFITEGGGTGIKLMFRVNFDSFFNVSKWTNTIHDTFALLALCRVCHVTYGTYMTPTMSSDILTIFSVFLNFVGTFLTSLIMYGAIGIIMVRAGVDNDGVKYIWRDGYAPYITITPVGLGFMAVPVLWTVLYFLACMLMVTNNLITAIDNIERSISDAHSRFRVYRNYMLATISISACLIGMLFSSKEAFVISRRLYRDVMEQVHCFDMFVLTILAFWIYRVQRLSDDVHFLHGSQPTKFWKIFWYLMPIITGVAFFNLTWLDKTKIPHEPFVLMHYLSYFILIAPIPIFTVVEVFNYLKIHNLVGILQPEERWGPPDPEERHLRHLFNPRQEIRSRRRDDTCEHNCLVGCKYVKKIAAEEKEERQRYLKSLLLEPGPISSSSSGDSSGVGDWTDGGGNFE